MANKNQINDIMNSMDKIVQDVNDQSVPKWRRFLSFALTACAILYDVCPVDMIPAFPLDNILITGAATFNLIQQNTQNQQALIVKISKYLKWLFVLLLILVVLVFGTLVALIANLISA